MNISMTPELEKFIHSKVESGMYQSASEVVREAVRLLAEHDENKRRRVEALNRDIQAGLDQLASGGVVSESALEEELEELLSAIEKKHG